MHIASFSRPPRCLMLLSSIARDGSAVHTSQNLSTVTRAVLSGALLMAALASCGGGSGSPPSAGPNAGASGTSSPGGSVPSTASSAGSAPTKVAPVPVESNPPGDIPDNLAFVRYRNTPGHYTFTHPEGWARTGSGTAVNFTDKLNGVSADSSAASTAPTVASARSTVVPALEQSVPAFHLRGITAVSLPGGNGVHIVYRRNSAADPVTGKVYRDEVEEYLVFAAGRLVRLDLYGPVGADNVDAYRTMSQSLRIR